MASAIPAASPCSGCDARCCRTYAVHVTGEDAFRLARGTGRDTIEFLAYLSEPDRSSTGFLLERGGPTYSLILETARGDEPQRPCVFLRSDPVTGEGRCGVYPIRPAACRRFPAVALDTGAVGVREGIVCPEGAWDGHPIDRLSWRVALARASRAWELHAVVAGEWNARVEDPASHRGSRTFEQYLDYLADVYAWIAQLRRALPPHDAAGPGLLLRVGDALRELPGS